MIGRVRRVCLALSLACVCGAGTSEAQGSPERIVVGTAVERTGSANDIHRYEIDLDAGDAIDLRATQEHFEVSLAVSAPDGAQIGRIRVTQVAPLVQAMTLVASTSGAHVIQIELAYVHSEAPSPLPTYTLDIGAKRPATDADRERARLAALANRASDLVRLRTLDGIRQAIPPFQQAAAGWRALATSSRKRPRSPRSCR